MSPNQVTPWSYASQCYTRALNRFPRMAQRGTRLPSPRQGRSSLDVAGGNTDRAANHRPSSGRQNGAHNPGGRRRVVPGGRKERARGDSGQRGLDPGPLKDLLPQLDLNQFGQVSRSWVVNMACVTSAGRDDFGKVTLNLRGRTDKPRVSPVYAHLFRQM